MIGLAQSLLAFVVALAALIAFHEFGHYWVARRCNVKVLSFSIGFGRPLWRARLGPDQTEFMVAWIPLGGYVQMLDERVGSVAPAERHRAFNNRPLMQRMAIILAGPLFNFIFAALAYWLIYVVGVTGLRPVVQAVEPQSPAMLAGLREEDRIVAVNGRETPVWNTVMQALVAAVIERNNASVTLRDSYGAERVAQLELASVSIDDLGQKDLLELLGVTPKSPSLPAVIGMLDEAGQGARAGLLVGDRILAVDGTPVENWRHWQALASQPPGASLSLSVERAGQRRPVMAVMGERTTETGARVGYLGVGPRIDHAADPDMFAVESYPVGVALLKGLEKTADMTLVTVRILGRMITGEASLANLSGPITIADYAGRTARMGIVVFLGFLALVSISLGVMNLLPVPILDGGRLLQLLVEAVKGSPLSMAMELAFQRVGIVLLFCLMSIAVYNDVLRLAQ